MCYMTIPSYNSQVALGQTVKRLTMDKLAGEGREETGGLLQEI